MLQIRKDLCLGCGLCAKNCPQQAILVLAGHAEIEQSRCNQCRLCVGICPRRAIVEMVPVSNHELQATVSSLKQRIDNIIDRIESLKSQKHLRAQTTGQNLREQN